MVVSGNAPVARIKEVMRRRAAAAFKCMMIRIVFQVGPGVRLFFFLLFFFERFPDRKKKSYVLYRVHSYDMYL